MDTAIKGYVDDKGNHRPHSASTLKELFAGDKAASKPETIIKQSAVVISANEWTDKLVLAMPDLDLEGWARLQQLKALGDAIQVVITRAPVAVTEQAEAA
jgi:hypothetical protein